MQDRHRSTCRTIEIVAIGGQKGVGLCNLLRRGRHRAPPARLLLRHGGRPSPQGGGSSGFAAAARTRREPSRPFVVRLALLGEGILPGLGLLPCQRERREGGAAFFLLVPLRLRLLLFLVAAHLTLGHGVPPVLACPRARAVEGFKRRRRTDSSALSLPRNLALARICCGSSTLGSRPGRLPPYFNYILNILVDYVMRLC